ncbi:hypothetical protein [Halorarius halobius]|uniref:hypothetical protein n=1 Tax=Halorarius halobius TaxID=2962671 RepID=UPI0020CC60F5|nr:hypothetical protein [Halorarius halobius]
MSRVDVEGQLLAGETREDELTVGGARLVRTSHRLLVARPDGEPRFRAVDWPNVGAVERGTDAPTWALSSALQALVVGVVLVAFGVVAPVDGLTTDVTAPGGTGLEGTLAVVRQLLALVRLLDDALLLGGTAGVLVGLALVGYYAAAREPVVVVGVSGAEPVRLPADGGSVARVRAFLAEA